MKKIQTLLFLIFLAITAWICVPEGGIPIQFTAGTISVDQTITPPKIHAVILGKRIDKEFSTQLGLDLKGGSHLVFDAKMDDVVARLSLIRHDVQNFYHFRHFYH